VENVNELGSEGAQNSLRLVTNSLRARSWQIPWAVSRAYLGVLKRE
jgi:hypothetical protein